MTAKRVFDTKVFYGPMEKLDASSGATNCNGMVNAITPEEKMHTFLSNEPVAKKDSFHVDQMVQSQAFDPHKTQMMVTITILFSWEGTEAERPSQSFNKAKPADRETVKFPTKAPALRQPETPVPVAPSAMPQRASSVPQIRPPAQPTSV